MSHQPSKSNAEIVTEFRNLIASLDDFNRSEEHPIKGDIYFDGIEVEQWILNQLKAKDAETKKAVEEIYHELERIMKIDIGSSDPTRLELQKYLSTLTPRVSNNN